MLEILEQLYNFIMLKRQLKKCHYATIFFRNSIQFGDCIEGKIQLKKSLRLLKTRVLDFTDSFNNKKSDEWINAIESIEVILSDDFFHNIDIYNIKHSKNDAVEKCDSLAIGFYSLYKMKKYSKFDDIIILSNFIFSDLKDLNTVFENSQK
jgi:hypothetical protein